MHANFVFVCMSVSVNVYGVAVVAGEEIGCDSIAVAHVSSHSSSDSSATLIQLQTRTAAPDIAQI